MSERSASPASPASPASSTSSASPTSTSSSARAAQELIASLTERPERLRELTLHFIGIGGIGVSAVARMLAERGAQVQGSDVRVSQLTEAMERMGARVTIGHTPKNLDGADAVVFSTAVPRDNVELIEAERRGLPLLHRSQALGLCLLGLESVGVTGTHGKGTVSAMITHALITAELDPSFIIGGILNQYKTNARTGRTTDRTTDSTADQASTAEDHAPCYGVAEVDESDGSHLNLTPQHTLVNHLEVDHLNYYEDLDAIIETMMTFLNRNERLKSVALNFGDEGVRRMYESLEPHAKSRVISYAAEGYYPQELGSLDALDFSAREIRDLGLSVRFNAYRGATLLGEVTLPIPGGYNAENAAGALAVTLGGLGVAFEHVQRALNTYEGLENRFTVRRDDELTVIKDYLSHPTGMRRVLESAHKIEHHKIWCVFKPYRFTLMRYHGEDYARAFTAASDVVITTMYAANEPSLPGINTEWFVDELRRHGNTTHFVPNQDDIVGFLSEHVSAGDLVFFFGGDDFFRMADAWMDQRAAQRAATPADAREDVQ